MAQILPFPSVPENSPLALFVRVGPAHNKLADLYAAGRLRANRVVVDASRLKFQQSFIRRLREDRVEIVLDTEIAELSSTRKFLGHSKSSPWMTGELRRSLKPSDFVDDSIDRLTKNIAAFAVANQVTTVLSPTHYLDDRSFGGWFDIDRKMALYLRRALDQAGGEAIALDYPIITSNTELRDVTARGTVAGGVSDLPIENIWIRSSGMEGVGGPLKTIQFLSSLERIHNLGRPIIADYLGGITAMAGLAFGVVSGVAHGIGERERFDASDWHLPPLERNEDDPGFGQAARVEIPYLGKAPTKKELQLLASAPGGRRVCSCGDKRCCPHGLDDMLRDPRSHAAFRATAAVQALEDVPPSRREAFFLQKTMADTVRTARSVANLRPADAEAVRLELDSTSLIKRYTAHSYRMDKLASAFEKLHERRSMDLPRAKAVRARFPSMSSPKEARK